MTYPSTWSDGSGRADPQRRTVLRASATSGRRRFPERSTTCLVLPGREIPILRRQPFSRRTASHSAAWFLSEASRLQRAGPPRAPLGLRNSRRKAPASCKTRVVSGFIFTNSERRSGQKTSGEYPPAQRVREEQTRHIPGTNSCGIPIRELACMRQRQSSAGRFEALEHLRTNLLAADASWSRVLPRNNILEPVSVKIVRLK